MEATTERTPGMGDNQPPLKDRLDIDYRSLVEEVERIAEMANNLPKEIETDEQLGDFSPIVKAARKARQEADGYRREEKSPWDEGVTTVNGFFNPLIDRLKRVQQVLEGRATNYTNDKAAAERRAREEEARAARAEEERQREIARREAERGRETAAAKKLDSAEEFGRKAEDAEAASQNVERTRVRSEDGLATTKKGYEGAIHDWDSIDLNELKPHFSRADVEKAIRGYVRTHRDTRPLAGVVIRETTKAQFR